MEIAMLVIGIILLIFAVFLVVAVLMQQGKAHNLSGAIAGGAETFFGKSKGQTINKKLSIITTVVAIIFVLLVCSVAIMQDSGKSIDDYDNFWQLLNPFDKEEAEQEFDPHDHDKDGKPDHTAEEHVDSETAGSDTAEPNKGDSNTADSNAADSNTADSNAADSNTADSNAADTNAADTNAADTNAADTNAADSDTAAVTGEAAA